MTAIEEKINDFATVVAENLNEMDDTINIVSNVAEKAAQAAFQVGETLSEQTEELSFQGTTIKQMVEYGTIAVALTAIAIFILSVCSGRHEYQIRNHQKLIDKAGATGVLANYRPEQHVSTAWREMTDAQRSAVDNAKIGHAQTIRTAIRVLNRNEAPV